MPFKTLNIKLLVTQRAGGISTIDQRAHRGLLGTKIAARAFEPGTTVTVGQNEPRIRICLRQILPKQRPRVILKSVVFINDSESSLLQTGNTHAGIGITSPPRTVDTIPQAPQGSCQRLGTCFVKTYAENLGTHGAPLSHRS